MRHDSRSQGLFDGFVAKGAWGQGIRVESKLKLFKRNFTKCLQLIAGEVKSRDVLFLAKGDLCCAGKETDFWGVEMHASDWFEAQVQECRIDFSQLRGCCRQSGVSQICRGNASEPGAPFFGLAMMSYPSPGILFSSQRKGEVVFRCALVFSLVCRLSLEPSYLS